MRYFSEREMGEPRREESDIGYNVWRGVLEIIRGRVSDGSFGARYPEMCEDGPFVCGTYVPRFEDAMLAEIPNLAMHVELEPSIYREPVLGQLGEPGVQPSTMDILDMVDGCWRNVSKANAAEYHRFSRHWHLDFDESAGKDEFRDDIERIFRRNRIAYELTEGGRIERTTPGILGDLSTEMDFDTGDTELDRLLNTASVKFRAPDQIMRREALESLWDAWERIKTLDSSDKKAGIAKLLDSAAGENSPKFRDALEREATELTKVGNEHRIRHSETHQEMLASNEHVDYLFYRMLSLIRLVMRSR